MKSVKKIALLSLYFILPLLAFFIVQLLFAYGTWEINPQNWHEDTRFAALLIGAVCALTALIPAAAINGYIELQ